MLAPVAFAMILGKASWVTHPNDTAVVVTTLLTDRICRLTTFHANHSLGIFLVTTALATTGAVSRFGLVLIRIDRDRRVLPLVSAPVHALKAAVAIIVVTFLAMQSGRFATLDTLYNARTPGRIHYRESVPTQLDVALMQHMETAEAILLLIAILVNALVAQSCRFLFMAMHT